MDQNGNTNDNLHIGDVLITQNLEVEGNFDVDGDVTYDGKVVYNNDVEITPPNCLKTDCIKQNVGPITIGDVSSVSINNDELTAGLIITDDIKQNVGPITIGDPFGNVTIDSNHLTANKLTTETVEARTITDDGTVPEDLTIEPAKNLFLNATTEDIRLDVQTAGREIRLQNRNMRVSLFDSALEVGGLGDAVNINANGELKVKNGVRAESTTDLTLKYNDSTNGLRLIDSTKRIQINSGGGNTLTFPASDGTVDQVLKTNGSGDLDWGDLPVGISDTVIAQQLFGLNDTQNIANDAKIIVDGPSNGWQYRTTNFIKSQTWNGQSPELYLYRSDDTQVNYLGYYSSIVSNPLNPFPLGPDNTGGGTLHYPYITYAMPNFIIDANKLYIDTYVEFSFRCATESNTDLRVYIGYNGDPTTDETKWIPEDPFTRAVLKFTGATQTYEPEYIASTSDNFMTTLRVPINISQQIPQAFSNPPSITIQYKYAGDNIADPTANTKYMGVEVARLNVFALYKSPTAGTILPVPAIDHGLLGGLAFGDPHPQYLLIDGTKAMTGDLDVNDNEIKKCAKLNGFNNASSITPGIFDIDFAIGVSSKMNIQSSNIISKVNVIPDIDSTHDLGSAVLKWNSVWTDNINGSAYPPASSGDVSYTGTGPTVSGQLVLMNSTDGKEIKQSTLTESTINGKLDKSGDTMTGNLNMSGSSVTETSQVRGITGGSLRLRNSGDTRNIDISQTDITVNTNTDEFIINSLGGVRLGTSTNIIPNTASTLGDVSNFFNSAFLGATTTSSVRARTVGTNELLFLNDNNTQVMKLLPNTSGAVLEFSGGAKMRSQNIEPVTNNTLNIGTSALRYNNIFTSNINPTTVGVPLVLGNTTDRVDLDSKELRYSGGIVSASYVPINTMRVIVNATVVAGDLLTASVLVDFRVVAIDPASPDETSVIGVALTGGTIGQEIIMSGAKILTTKSDSISVITRGDPVEKSDTDAGTVQDTAVSVGTIGRACQSVGASTTLNVWVKLNEVF